LLIFSSNFYMGEEKDRNATITIKKWGTENERI
jgi:hypothetical protein